MNIGILTAVVVLIGALVVYLSLPYIVHFSLSKGYKNTNRTHDIVVSRKSVRLGGVSLFLGVILSLSLALQLCLGFGAIDAPLFRPLLCKVVATVALFVVGVYDDINGIGYKKKFLAQVVATLLVIYSGGCLTTLNGLFGINELSVWVGVPLSLFFVIFITNSINFIDGIDGLLAAISISAFSLYGVSLVASGDVLYALVSFSLLGGLLTFFYFNVFGMRRYPATKIMMGDCGSLTLGFILSFMAIKLWEVPTANNLLAAYSHIIALTMLAIPSLDAVTVIMQRVQRRHSIFLPDKCHIHHRLIRAGFSKHRTLLIIALANLGYLALNILLATYLELIYIVAIDVAIWIILNSVIYNEIKKYEKDSTTNTPRNTI